MGWWRTTFEFFSDNSLMRPVASWVTWATAASLVLGVVVSCGVSGSTNERTRAQVEAIAEQPVFDVELAGYAPSDTFIDARTEGGQQNHSGTVSKNWTPQHSSSTFDAKPFEDVLFATGWTLHSCPLELRVYVNSDIHTVNFGTVSSTLILSENEDDVIMVFADDSPIGSPSEKCPS